jgi:hypothetical protein
MSRDKSNKKMWSKEPYYNKIVEINQIKKCGVKNHITIK